jgi:Holliday junction resolvase RusA-like endonuclease
MEIDIRAEVRSKKNSRILTAVKGKYRSFSSSAYAAFCEEAKQQIMIQKIPPQAPPYEIWYRFYLKGNKRIDLDNAIASINDILQEMRVIDDDQNIVHLHARKMKGCSKHRTIVTIVQAREENYGIT